MVQCINHCDSSVAAILHNVHSATIGGVQFKGSLGADDPFFSAQGIRFDGSIEAARQRADEMMSELTELQYGRAVMKQVLEQSRMTLNRLREERGLRQLPPYDLSTTFYFCVVIHSAAELIETDNPEIDDAIADWERQMVDDVKGYGPSGWVQTLLQVRGPVWMPEPPGDIEEHGRWYLQHFDLWSKKRHWATLPHKKTRARTTLLVEARLGARQIGRLPMLPPEMWFKILEFAMGTVFDKGDVLPDMGYTHSPSLSSPPAFPDFMWNLPLDAAQHWDWDYLRTLFKLL